MARFQYQALSASGEVVAGEIDGPDVATVIARLNEQALLPIRASEKRESAGLSLDLSFGRRNVSCRCSCSN
jgi:type II secretory pathway component PulF